MDNGVLRTANLGDSGFMVVRKGEVLFRTKEQQHSFNFPYQLGGKTSKSGDLPEHSNVDTIRVEPGDIVILGTDGLWDNLYDVQVLKCVHETKDPSKLARLIATTASEYAHKRSGPSPFADGVWKSKGIVREGGKVDDITVLVGRVRSGDGEIMDDDDKIIGGLFSKMFAKL